MKQTKTCVWGIIREMIFRYYIQVLTGVPPPPTPGRGLWVLEETFCISFLWIFLVIDMFLVIGVFNNYSSIFGALIRSPKKMLKTNPPLSEKLFQFHLGRSFLSQKRTQFY